MSPRPDARHRRRAIAATGLAVVALVAAACGSDDPGTAGSASSGDGDRPTLTVMLDWTPNTHHIGMYVAQAQGLYEEAGLDVEIVETGAGGVEQAVASGAADIGISTSEALLPARAAGLALVSVAAVAPHNWSSLLSLAADGISRPRDLEGRTYGGYGGPLETELLDSLVTCDGGDFSKVTTTEVGDVDYLAGLEQDRFDVVWVFSGWDALRAREIEGASIAEISFQDHTDCIPDWYTPIYVTSESALDDRADDVDAFLAATAAGYQVAVEDPDQAAALMHGEVPESDEALLIASAEYYSTRFIEPGSTWGVQEASVWADFEAFALEAGLLEEPVDSTRAFTNDHLPGPGSG